MQERRGGDTSTALTGRPRFQAHWSLVCGAGTHAGKLRLANNVNA
jgi:hypothetical protein